MVSYFPFSNCRWGAIHKPPYIEINSLLLKTMLSILVKFSDRCYICLRLLFATIDISFLSTFLLPIFFSHILFISTLLLLPFSFGVFSFDFLWPTKISVWCVILSYVGKNYCYPNRMLIWFKDIYYVLFSFYIIVSLFVLSKLFLCNT